MLKVQEQQKEGEINIQYASLPPLTDTTRVILWVVSIRGQYYLYHAEGIGTMKRGGNKSYYNCWLRVI